MSTINVELPDSLHEEIRKLAQREKVSVNHIVTLAVAEKIAALDAEDYLRERAARADKTKFQQALEKVPDVPCAEEDAL
jgi:hypothetical protein